MKTINRVILGLFLAGTLFLASNPALAFDANDYCATAPKKPGSSFNYWYTKYKTGQPGIATKDGYYVLCFDPNSGGVVMDVDMNLVSVNDVNGVQKPLIVWGARFKFSAGSLVLKGPSVILQNVEVAGPGSDKVGSLGIRVEGDDNAIIGSKITNFETGVAIGNGITSIGTKIMGPSMLIDSVKTGINVASAGETKIENVTIKATKSRIIPAHKFDNYLVGRRCETVQDVKVDDVVYKVCDGGKIDPGLKKLAGKLPMGVTTCGNTVHLFKKLADLSFVSLASCPYMVLPANAEPIGFLSYVEVVKDKVVKINTDTVEPGECYFECVIPDDANLNLSSLIYMGYGVYDPAVNSTIVYDGLVHWNDFEVDGNSDMVAKVIGSYDSAVPPSVMGPIAIPITGSEMETGVKDDNKGNPGAEAANDNNEGPGAGPGSVVVLGPTTAAANEKTDVAGPPLLTDQPVSNPVGKLSTGADDVSQGSGGCSLIR
jgi:hypothetical protein